jgi:putative glutamine amidotransferase
MLPRAALTRKYSTVGNERPTVGVTASLETVRYADWADPAAFVPLAYARAVQRAGARALVLAPDEEDVGDPVAVLDMLDALIVSGGSGDVDPHLYGEEPHPRTKPVEPVRDRYELALVRAAAERDLPMLGICRGMQVINVAYGGKLEQHLPDALGHDRHAHTPGVFSDHEVRLEPGSLAARAAGDELVPVKSFHHQGIKEVGGGLAVSGHATIDETVEAIEDPNRSFVLGVLWHPEEDERSRLIGAVVDAGGGAPDRAR